MVVTSRANGATEATAISNELVDRIAGIDGVLTAQGTFDQPIGVRLPSGAQADVPVVLRGLVFTSAWSSDRWRVVEGEAPTLNDRPSGGDLPIALDAGGERSADATLGDRIQLQTPIGGVSARVVGLVRPAGDGGADSVGQVSSPVNDGATGAMSIGVIDARVVIDPRVLPALLDAEGRLDRITAIPVPGTDLDELAARLRSSLPADLEVSSAKDADAVTAQTVQVISEGCLLYTSPSPRDRTRSRMPSSA